MPIFVTGGTGFLGLNLVRLLVDRGERVRVLTRATSGRLGLDSDLIEFVRGDVTDVDSLREAMSGCDRAYHLAGWVQISPWGWAEAWKTNVEGTRNVCSAALESGVSRVVHASSIAAIGAGTLDEPADERSPWNIRADRIPYYATKVASEKVVLEHVERGLDAVIVNPTYVVGPWDVKPTAGRLLIKIATRKLRSYPSRGGLNFVDVRSVAVGHVLAMERGRSGERYILGGENLPFKAYLDRVAGIAGVATPGIRLPYAGMFPFALAGSILGRLLPRAFRDTNLSVLRSSCLEHYVSSAKASRELGYEVASVDAAIRDGMAWFVEHGYMKPTAAFPAPGQD